MTTKTCTIRKAPQSTTFSVLFGSFPYVQNDLQILYITKRLKILYFFLRFFVLCKIPLRNRKKLLKTLHKSHFYKYPAKKYSHNPYFLAFYILSNFSPIFSANTFPKLLSVSCALKASTSFEGSLKVSATFSPKSVFSTIPPNSGTRVESLP